LLIFPTSKKSVSDAKCLYRKIKIVLDIDIGIVTVWKSPEKRFNFWDYLIVFQTMISKEGRI
jgi:hypothetical protein